VDWALHKAEGCVADKFNITVGNHDIRTLRDRQWLNDEIVNFYVNLLMERSEKEEGWPKIHCFNTFFYPTLRDSGYQKVRRWTKKVG
jgi:sentrin-specific protease 1